jgi:hypothetical protein
LEKWLSANKTAAEDVVKKADRCAASLLKRSCDQTTSRLGTAMTGPATCWRSARYFEKIATQETATQEAHNETSALLYCKYFNGLKGNPYSSLGQRAADLTCKVALKKQSPADLLSTCKALQASGKTFE